MSYLSDGIGDTPTIGLFGQHSADEPDDRIPVREDPDHIGAAADFLVQPLLWVVRPDLTPDLVREHRKRQQVLASVVEMCRRVSESGGDRVDDAAELVAHRGASGWSKMVRTMVATHGCAERGTFVNRLRR